MTPALPDREHWRPIAEMLDGALELPREERSAFLDRVCAGRAELRADVEAFLDADSRAGDFLATPLGEYVETLLEGPEPAATRGLPAGRRLGPYEVVRELGGGGMGVVYEGRDTRLGRRVALKLLPPAWSRSPVAKERFVREARAAAALDHPNLCTVYDVGESDDGRLFIVMPCYEGETLEKKIARGPLPPETARALAAQVARGLEKAHQAGIVHRDVKPANVLVSESGEPPPGRARVLDFGIARVAGDPGLTREGVSPGTPAYMAPEQITGGPIDAKADIWALGVMLYEMLTGRRPFAGDDAEAVRHAILHRPPEPLARGVPADLARVVERALTKNPAERYRRIGDLLADLDPAGRRPRAIHRKWRLAAALAACILVVLVVLVVLAALAGSGWLRRSWVPAVPEPSATPPTAAEGGGVEAAVPVVGVLSFVNRSGDPALDGHGESLAQLVADALVSSRYLYVVSAPRLDPLRRAAGPGERARLAAKHGIEALASGEILLGPRGLILASRLVHTGDGRELASLRLDDLEPAELLAAAPEIAQQIRKGLGVPPTETVAVFAADFASRNPEAYELYVRGLEAFGRFDYAKAEEMFTAALAKAPDFTMARCRLAHVEAVTGRTGEAQASIRRAAGEAHRLPDRDRRYVLAMEAYIARRYGEATRAYREILERYPYDLEARHSLARLLYASRRWKEALTELEILLRLEPDNPILWSHAGATRLALGDFARAVADLQRYIELDPGSANGHHSLGDAYRAQGELGLAAAEYTAALEIDPSFHFATVSLAVTDALSGRRKDAEARLAALVTDTAAAPRHRLDAAFELASLYRSTGRFRRAAETLAGLSDLLVAENVREALALAVRGTSRMELGETEAARRLLELAVERTPAGGAPTRYLFARGLFELHQGRLAEVEATAERILEAARPADDPDRTEEKAAAYLLGRARLAAGDPAAALPELARTVTLEGYEYTVYRLGLADAYLAAGKLPEALAAAHQARREIDPAEPRLDLELDRARALLVLARVQEALGRPAEAAARARDFLALWEEADPNLPDLAEAQRLAALGEG